ncbi:hypothetical protein [Diplocloster hominis]|uniref:hypothetical protein n=1 Tax=Diplocloster hominis TaxID=3079010 RepID=UPI0031BAB17E
MFDKLNHVTLSGVEYPIKCDMLVLERIQNEYGSIAKFEREIISWEPVLDENGEEVLNDSGIRKVKSKLPSVKAVNDALYWMVTEGMDIEAAKKNEPCKEIKREELLRCVDMPYMKLADLVHDEFSRCFEDPKNEETT